MRRAVPSAVLVSQKRGATFGGIVLPVAVQAILFDLMNGGEKDWIEEPMTHRPPYWDLGRDAALAARRTSRWARSARLRRHDGEPEGRARLGQHAHEAGLHVGAWRR